MLEVIVLSPQRVIFEGGAKSVILPGENGVFEILSFHKNIMSRLLKGNIIIDGERKIPIRRGVIKVERNIATIIVEEG
jgi:F-type H+-transporting ATPase subunit epsilon